MSYTFRVLFSGLCAFVPDKPFDQLNDPPTEVTVLLQNLLRPKPLTLSLTEQPGESEPPNFLEPHFPLLEFDLSDLHPQSHRKPDLSRTDTGKGGCFLFGEEVSFDLNLKKGQKRRLRIPDNPRFQPARQQEEETRFDRESLYWLARLDKASPGNFVEPSLLTSPLSLDGEPAVLTRLKLTHGFLRVSQLSDKVCEFHPPDPQRPYRQKIATELALDIEGVTGPVVVVGRDPERMERRLTLTPVKSPGLVEIRIQNRELDSLLAIPETLLPPSEKPDFEVFYHLIASTANAAPQNPRRFPKQPVNEDGGSIKNPSLCPPTALALAPANAA